MQLRQHGAVVRAVTAAEVERSQPTEFGTELAQHVDLARGEARIRELEREVSELRTANDILKDALGFFVKDADLLRRKREH